MNPTEKTLVQRFDALAADCDALDAQLVAKWAELDGIVGGTAAMTLAEATAREPVLREEIRALQLQRMPLENERGQILRALGGKITADQRAEAAA